MAMQKHGLLSGFNGVLRGLVYLFTKDILQSLPLLFFFSGMMLWCMKLWFSDVLVFAAIG